MKDGKSYRMMEKACIIDNHLQIIIWRKKKMVMKKRETAVLIVDVTLIWDNETTLRLRRSGYIPPWTAKFVWRRKNFVLPIHAARRKTCLNWNNWVSIFRVLFGKQLDSSWHNCVWKRSMKCEGEIHVPGWKIAEFPCEPQEWCLCKGNLTCKKAHQDYRNEWIDCL